MKFAHLADTHIRNLKYHYEYRVIFDQIYDKLREEKVDCIVHCGDLAHTKTQLSPEYFEMASGFLKNLADIAPTYIIPGNHDGNLRNSSRQDAITPIVDALEHPNLHLLKNSGETSIDDRFVLNVLSVFDEENWANPTDSSKINVAVYHGSISGVATDLGWIMEYGEHDISIFKEFDFAFLGDIHKTNQVLDDDGRVRYPGSTIQQNHGETNDKGLLIWDIQDRDRWDVKHISFVNPKPFITVELTPKGRISKKTSIPTGARLRLVSNNNLSLDVLKRSVDIAKSRFKPESITFLNRAAGERGSIEDTVKNLVQEDLRDAAVQKQLIKEYIKDYNPSDETLDKVLDLNKKYNSVVEQNEEVSRNVNWKLKSLEWDNLFNYGEQNKINFEKLNGIVGIFGKNYSGKSSVIDSLLYTVYNSTSKNSRKNLHLINQTKEECRGRAEISINNSVFKIERVSEKYEKRLHGNTTMEAKTDVEFNQLDEVTEESVSLNGLSRNDTDKNIRKLLGTVDDFLFTSMASQLGSLMFINEGSTKRKELLAKFLDLEVFENKYRLAKEDVVELRAALKRFEGKEYNENISEALEQLKENEKETKKQQGLCDSIKKSIKHMLTELQYIKNNISNIPAEIIDIHEVKLLLEEKISQKKALGNKNKELYKLIKTNNALLNKIEKFLNEDFDIVEIRNKKELVAQRHGELSNLLHDIQSNETSVEGKKNKIHLLEEVPCGEEFSHCKFIRDAYAALKTLESAESVLGLLKENRNNLEKEIQELGPDKIAQHMENYDKLVEKKNNVSSNIGTAELDLQKNKTANLRIRQEVKDLKNKIQKYEENKEVIENLEGLNAEKKNLEKQIASENKNLDNCQNEIFGLYKLHGSVEQQLANLEEEQQELESLREQFAAYELLMRCMHPNGIAYDVIKKRLPIINAEVAKVLANIVDFEIFFEAEDKKLEIFIKHPKFDARPIELGSGSEKTIAAMAIRLALLSVSSLPKPDLFILDEPATALDEENMEGFIRILDMVKSCFKTVLLISHLESLKDCVDMTIEIDKKDGFAHVNF
tara:strand:- start:528 stop:3683 length:3156 start_codon:yes stop_codon:yes gene_type:complete